MKTLESFDFGRASSGDRGTYDWDAILDGDVHVLEAGVDFKCKPITLKSRARTVAKKMDKSVRTASDKDGNVIIQAYEAAEETEFDRKKKEAAKKLAAGRKAAKAVAGKEDEGDGDGEGDEAESEIGKPAPKQQEAPRRRRPA